MADTIKMEDLIEKTDSTSETAQTGTEVTTEVATEEEVEQGSLKTELERVQKVSKYTEKEKAEHALKMNFKRAAELGVDVSKVLGFESKVDVEEIENEDDKPLTIGMLKKIQQENAAKSALQQADEIPNEVERELVKHHLENTIRSTGNPSEDLKLARALVNSVKNTRIVEEVSRKVAPKSHSSGSGVDANKEQAVTYSQEELTMMKAPFNMTPQEIIEARAGKKYAFKN